VSTTLLAGVAKLLDTSGVAASCTGGVYFGVIPEEDWNPPHCVIRHRGEVPEWTTEDAYQEVGQVTLAFYGVGARATEDLATQAKAAFDWQELPLSGVDTVEIRRTAYRVDVEDARDADGQVIFRAELDYQIILVRTY
jgi:hypothetical protein